MLREIKFRYRVRNVRTKEISTQFLTIGELEGQYAKTYAKGWHWDYFTHMYEILYRDEYTGQRDIKGKKIYENDIVFAYANDSKYIVKHGEYNNIEIIDTTSSTNCYGWYIVREGDMSCESIEASEKYLKVIGDIHSSLEFPIRPLFFSYT